MMVNGSRITVAIPLMRESCITESPWKNFTAQKKRERQIFNQNLEQRRHYQLKLLSGQSDLQDNLQPIAISTMPLSTIERN